MKVKNIFFIALALALVGAIVYKAVWSKPAQAKSGGGLARAALPVNLLVVKPQSFIETLSVTGTVEANEEVLLKSEVSGKITGIFFNEGTRVDKGTLLIKVYDDDLQAQLTKAQANLKLTEEVEARQKQLLEREAISRQDYDVAYANLQSAQADVALFESQISKTEIRAPFDGTIGFRKVSPGEYITPGTEIASLVNNHPAKIQFAVPEKYSRVLGKNTVIKYRLEGMLDERTASVYAVDPAIDQATRTLQLKALSPNLKGELIPGAFVRINVLMEKSDNVILVPTEAVISETDGQKAYLFRNGNVEKVTVETGTRTNSKVEIVRGIHSGDTLITTGMMQITPRSMVTPAVIN
ncbi:MAG: efflux RND transporter periplasmic adaptor subunit [Bacteroidales bacterium]|jgi:membrane fusion protein (multidrug efflux system)|nr:efflux RND transporter periplasmic adaptor subunit [Bacteroidales bacterium]